MKDVQPHIGISICWFYVIFCIAFVPVKFLFLWNMCCWLNLLEDNHHFFFLFSYAYEKCVSFCFVHVITFIWFFSIRYIVICFRCFPQITILFDMGVNFMVIWLLVLENEFVIVACSGSQLLWYTGTNGILIRWFISITIFISEFLQKFCKSYKNCSSYDEYGNYEILIRV